MGSQTGKSEQQRPRQALGSSHPFTFQTKPISQVEFNPREHPEQQGTASATQQPFTFQPGPTPTFAPPSEPFNFQAGPTYSTPVLSSALSPINTRTESPSSNVDSDNDWAKLHRLEDEVEDLHEKHSGLQREVHQLLGQQGEQVQGRSSRLPLLLPSPSPRDDGAELRRLRWQREFQEAAATKAYNDGRRTEVEVRRQAIRDGIEDKRKDWWDKNKERQASPPRNPFPISPATIAAPQTSFTTTLAYRPASGPPPPSRIPVPSRSLSHPRSLQRDKAVPSRVRPPRKGIFWNRDENLWIRPKPLKFVRFNNVVHYREFSDDADDDYDNDE
jgi:hypothetical protein